MKKLIASALAAAMLLTCSTAAFAASTETITDKSYDLSAQYVESDGSLSSVLASDTKVNSLTVKYPYESIDEVVTGRFTEDARMAIITVEGFDTEKLDGGSDDDYEITIDGKAFEKEEFSSAAYYDHVGYDEATGTLQFPVELTKAGYTDSYLISVVATDDDGNTCTETAKISLTLVNESEYKTAKTATISKIMGENVDAYIVGSKIYLDYASSSVTSQAKIELTFKDENGDLFNEVTWAYSPSSDAGEYESLFVINDDGEDKTGTDGMKLEDSTATYRAQAITRGTGDYISNVVFKLETASAIYETKEYDVVLRTDIYEADPKGIYFAETSKTISIGESYTPVVMGVATNKLVDAEIVAPDDTDRQVIDVDDDTVIGTQEGVAYITATYTFVDSNNSTKTYDASSMKITVTAEAQDDDEEEDSTRYMVTASTLNVRKGPGTSYAKADYQLDNGEIVNVVSVANGWAQLEDGNYVSAQYLIALNEEDGEGTVMYVTCRTLNVRTGPSTSYAKAGTLSRGTAVNVVSISNNWAKLSDGTYVSALYLAE